MIAGNIGFGLGGILFEPEEADLANAPGEAGRKARIEANRRRVERVRSSILKAREDILTTTGRIYDLESELTKIGVSPGIASTPPGRSTTSDASSALERHLIDLGRKLDKLTEVAERIANKP